MEKPKSREELENERYDREFEGKPNPWAAEEKDLEVEDEKADS